MPFCPNCKVEYRPGFTKCADCDVDLVESLDEEKSEVLETDQGKYVTLGEWIDPVDLRGVCELLEDSDINCIVQGAEAKSMIGTHSSSGARVLVPELRLDEAKELTEAFFSDDPPNDDIEFLECSECGCPIDPEDEICPACGAELGDNEG